MSNLLTASPLVFPIGFLLFFHCSNILAHLAMSQISIPTQGLAEARHFPHRHDVQRIAPVGAVNTPELAEPGIPLVGRKQQQHYTADRNLDLDPDHRQLAAGKLRRLEVPLDRTQIDCIRLLVHPLR